MLAYGGQLAHAYVSGKDDRQRWFSDGTHADRQSSSAIGGIVCDDATIYSGFIIDVSRYAPGFEQPVLLTTAHTFVDPKGRSRGVCRYLSGGRFDDQWVISRINLGIKADIQRKPADSGDWALAIVNTPESGSFTGVRPMFADEYDFDRSSLDPAQYVTASFSYKLQGIWMATECRPDDKRNYPAFAATDVAAADFRRMIIHDCDYAGGGSGGPLFRQAPEGLRVIGINTGDTIERKPQPARGAGYAPPDAFNFSRRLDRDLEQALIRYLRSFE